MNLELSLVTTQSPYAVDYTLLTRKRYKNPIDTLEAIKSFITDNHALMTSNAIEDWFDNYERIVTLKEFVSFNYLLSLSGIKILVHTVADNEIHETSIPENLVEYVIEDRFIHSELPSVAAIKMTDELTSLNIGELYKSILINNNFFNESMFPNNPLKTRIDLLVQSSGLTGRIPENIAMEVNSILELLGINIITITQN